MPSHPPATEVELHAMTRLYEVGTLCARNGSPFEECLDRLLDTAIDLGDADAGLLHILGHTGDGPGLRLRRGLDERWADCLPGASDQAAAMEAAWRRGLRVMAHDLVATGDAVAADGAALPVGADCRQALRSGRFHAFVSTPLLGGADELLGVITLLFREAHHPAERQLRLSDLLCRQAADYLQRRASESAVRESEARLRAFTGATTDAVYRISADWSEVRELQGRQFVRHTHEPGTCWLLQHVPVEDRPAVRQAIADAVASKAVFELEFRVILADGSIGWTHSRAVPVLDRSGVVVEWFGTASDITQRKHAQEALQLSEMRYRTLFDSIDEGYCIIHVIFDAQGRGCDYEFIEVNRSFERQTGMRDVFGRSVRTMLPDHEPMWYEIYGQIARTGQPARFQHAAKALGRYYDVYAFPFGDPQDHQVAVLFNDVSERRRQEQALREADRRKDEFLATLAHELRNPLAPIRSGLDILQLSGDNVGTAAARVLPMLRRQVDHMVRLVDDLLEVARIAGGKVELRPQRLDIATVLHDAVETSKPQIDAAHHRLVMELPGEPLVVDADPTRLAQVVANLLNNAAKYSDAGSRIRVAVARAGGEVQVTVEDHGIGIAADMLPRVFDPFVQAEHHGARAQGGLGIGLTLVRSLVEMHGGRVDAASGGLGRGSTFTVHLPLAPAVEDEAAVAGAGAAVPQRQRRILVVDDNVDAADTLGALVSMLGLEARIVHSGAAALAALHDFAPDLVLLDIGMPGMDGYELARRIHQDHGARRPVLVAVTGWGQEEDRRRSLEVGIDDHLVKPIGLADLERVLAATAQPAG